MDATIMSISFTQVHIWPMVIAGVFMLIGYLVSNRLKTKFDKYSKTTLVSNMSGKEIAERMLADHGIHDVKVTCTPGTLTDHYNPTNKTVNLSQAVHDGRNAAAAAVSAHECGHAVQHATAYKALGFRSKMVPALQVASNIMPLLVMGISIGSYFAFSAFPLKEVLYAIVALNAVIALFAIVTLPVEFDASKRALVWIKKNGVVTQTEYEMSKDALKWAAMTYLVSALMAIANLAYWVMRLMGSDD